MSAVEEDRVAFENCRVYLPAAGKEGISQNESLHSYIEREFPEATQDKKMAVYSVPRAFKPRMEQQASHAEQLVFDRLTHLTPASSHQKLWMLFFHGASYAGHSYRNQRVGKLMIREHDFVLFTKYNEQHYVTLAEVKSTHVGAPHGHFSKVSSDARVVKNNKRSAQHQLRDHMELLYDLVGAAGPRIQCYIMWPFLNAYTKDPNHMVVPRWKEDGNLHVFEHSLTNQTEFNEWFETNVLTGEHMDKQLFHFLLNRFIILSCGVFVDEIHRGIITLLTQEQLTLLTATSSGSGRWGYGNKGPLVVHGAAGTGKTLLILRKLQLLYERGELNSENKALYICYWPGLRCDFQNKLKRLPFTDYVDSAKFYISQTGFLSRNKCKYKHIFMDEAEGIRLSYDNTIITSTFLTIYQKYHDGNCTVLNCANNAESCKNLEESTRIFENHEMNDWGELWFLVDTNQTLLFSPKHSPDILQKPNLILNKVMRTTGQIYNVFKQFYSHPTPNSLETLSMSSSINIGHNITGPPIFWIDTDTNLNVTTCDKILHLLVCVVIDLVATKGVKPNDLCVIPFLLNEKFTPQNINHEISTHFVDNAYQPHAIGNVEEFISRSQLKDFLITWGLRVKGLEFKVIIIVIEEEDFEIHDAEDRKKMYIMASRCTCLLIVLCNAIIKTSIDLNNSTNSYSFGLTF